MGTRKQNRGGFTTELREHLIGGHVAPRSLGGGSYSVATCNDCGATAWPLSHAPECHACSDWNGCGTDCTRSGWKCSKCSNRECSAHSVEACLETERQESERRAKVEAEAAERKSRWEAEAARRLARVGARARGKGK